MVDTNIVCSMCGDIGFPEKLFQCIRCRYRSQHSYCTNYYSDEPSEVCDWCLSEERGGLKYGGSHSKKPGAVREASASAEKPKESIEREEIASGSRVKSGSGASSSKAAGRRYKLLKDVLC
ncbi:uncharacterized protein LOC109708221 [Ananas comosus]|uniref:Uncharacterized protein LOC109708221 n=2 Tax=Ananas comosus TaxID=4615 RepID=A0A6P5EPN2_ANACO|nr:uncharacterized protein LOC109708221 [Ananas comosus]CAD1844888.1 unnamed protein product [Ananas comosus var. bracteatus]